MCEIILNLEPELSLKDFKKRIENITRDYSLAVIEGTESGNEYPDASANVRFLNEFIFAISCSIKETKIYKYKNAKI